MTQAERGALSARFLKAADYAKKEWEFYFKVLNLCHDDVVKAYQRYRMLEDAATDVYDFNFGEGE